MYDSSKPATSYIESMAKSTRPTPYITAGDNNIVTELFYKHYRRYRHADGVGTKVVYYAKQGNLTGIMLDAARNNLHDALMDDATITEAIPTIVLPEENREWIEKMMETAVSECQLHNIAISAGETEFDNTIGYPRVYMVMLGFVEGLRENKFRKGQHIVGFASSGLHSNGFTRVRELFCEEERPEFTIPVQSYYKEGKMVCGNVSTGGRMNLTGRAFPRFADALASDADLIIWDTHVLDPQPILYEIYERCGCNDEEMYRIYNNGIGFAISVYSSEDAETAMKYCTSFKSDVIGEVVPGTGRVIIHSKYSNRELIYTRNL